MGVSPLKRQWLIRGGKNKTRDRGA